MGLVFIDVIDRCTRPIDVCDDVYLCLPNDWKDKTVSGLPFASAEVVMITKLIDSNVSQACCDEDPTCNEFCRYHVKYDDTQFKLDGDQPYVLTGAEVQEIIPYPCSVAKLLENIGGGNDVYLDIDNVTITLDDDANTATITLPMLSRDFNGVLSSAGSTDVVIPGGTLAIGSGTLTYTSLSGEETVANICDIVSDCIDGVTIDYDGSTFTATPSVLSSTNEILTHVSGDGTVTNHDICDMVSNCIDNSTIIVNGSGELQAVAGGSVGSFATLSNALSGTSRKQFSGDSTIIYQGPSTLTYNDTTGSPGPGAWLVQGFSFAGVAWTVHRVAEHATLCQTVKFAAQNFSAPGGSAPDSTTLQTGTSLVTTPAYRETTFNNPSSHRSMTYTVFASQSFAGESVPASGQVVWGNCLWINGSRVADQNGRSLPGFGISWSDSSGFFQDYTMPLHFYSGVMPPGGSVTVGLDFGDNNVFPTTATIGAVAVESFLIGIVGSTG